MATTTNYGWTTPDDTALVKDGASAIRSLGTSVDTTTKNLNPETTLGDISYRSSTANVNTRLPLGTAGQVLKVNSGATAPEWATDASGMTNPMTTTGDTIYSSSGSTPARLAIGSTGNVLTVAGGVPTWAAPAAGGMTQLGTTTLSGTSYTFSAIPQSGYTQLYLEIIGPNAATAFDLNVEPQQTDGTGGDESYFVGHYYNGSAAGTGYTTYTAGSSGAKSKIRLTYPGSSRANYSYVSNHSITFYTYWNTRATFDCNSAYQLDSNHRIVFHQTGAFELSNIYNLKINSSQTLTGGTATLWGVK